MVWVNGRQFYLPYPSVTLDEKFGERHAVLQKYSASLAVARA
jgi:hypothetical protein